MAEEPDQIRDDIEVTRDRLANDVDRLADKTSPSRIAQRRVADAKAKMHGLSDRVMGNAHDNGGTVKDKASGAVDTAKDKASDVAGQVTDRVRQAPAAVGRQTQGNPVATGLVAFGAGMLAASLLPATGLEKRAGRQLRAHADDLVEPVRQPLAESAEHLREDLGSHAQESLASVRDTAKEAARSTAQTAKDAAADAKQA